MNFYMPLYQYEKNLSARNMYKKLCENIILRNIIPRSLIGSDCESRRL